MCVYLSFVDFYFFFVMQGKAFHFASPPLLVFLFRIPLVTGSQWGGLFPFFYSNNLKKKMVMENANKVKNQGLLHLL